MNIKKAIKGSFILQFLNWIKEIGANSFIFKRKRKNNSENLSENYTTWIDTSFIYKLIMKLDMALGKLEKGLYKSIVNSSICIIIYKLGQRFARFCRKALKNLDNPVFQSSIFINYIKKLKDKITIKKLLIALTIGYIFIDVIFRNLNFLSRFATIWDELLLLALFLYVLIVRVKSAGNLRVNLTPMSVPIAIYIIFGIIHVFFISPEINVAIEGFRAVFQQALWYFAITQIVITVADSKMVMNLMVAMGLFLGIHGTYQYITKVAMPGNWVDVTETIETRAFSIVGSPNILGALFVLLIPISIGMFLTNDNVKHKSFYFVSALFMVVGLVFTFSRGAWLAFAFSMFIYLLLLNYKLIIPFMIIGAMTILSGGRLSQRLMFMLSPSYMEKSAAGGRIHRWKIGLDVWKKNKLLGKGLGRYGGAVAMNNKLSPFYLDNYYLKTLTEMGIYGIISLAFVVITFIISSLKMIKYQGDKNKKILNISLFASGIGILAQNFVENIFEVPAMGIYFWILVAIMNTLAPKKKESI